MQTKRNELTKYVLLLYLYNYFYDINGNINVRNSHGLNRFVYEGNKLVKVDNSCFSYDRIGNPTIYKCNMMKWDFRNLKEYLGVAFPKLALALAIISGIAALIDILF